MVFPISCLWWVCLYVCMCASLWWAGTLNNTDVGMEYVICCASAFVICASDLVNVFHSCVIGWIYLLITLFHFRSWFFPGNLPHMQELKWLTNDVYEYGCVCRATLPDKVVGITSLPSEDSVSERQEELIKVLISSNHIFIT